MDLTQEFGDFLEDNEDENGDMELTTPAAASQLAEVVTKMLNAEQEQRPFDPGAYLENLNSSQALTPFANFQIQTNPKSYWTNYVNVEDNNNNNNNSNADANQNNTINDHLIHSNMTLNMTNNTGNIIIQSGYKVPLENPNNNNTHLMNVVTEKDQSLNDDFVENSEMNMDVDHVNPDDELFAIHRLNRYIDTLNVLQIDDVPVDKCLMVCQSITENLLSIVKTSSNLKKSRAQVVLLKGGKLLSKLFDQFGLFPVTNANHLLKLLVSSVLQQKFDSVLSQMELYDFLSDFTAAVENTDIRQCLFDNTILIINELVKRIKSFVNNHGSFVKYEDTTSLYNGFSLLKQLITTSSMPSDQRKQVLNLIQVQCIEYCTEKLPFSSINYLAVETLEILKEKYDTQDTEEMES